MDNNKDRNVDPEKLEQQEKKQQTGVQFNAGNNDSDYDGGHPGESFSQDEERSSEENAEDGSFNAGQNDSDYDGGHPGDSSPAKK